MHRIIVFFSIMGLMAFMQSFGLVLICMCWTQNAYLQMDFPHLQTMLFLKLAAGALSCTRVTLFAPRYPTSPLFLAVVDTQIVAAPMCA
jgi:H+-transporting ATPase